jgi:hypothetical protein
VTARINTKELLVKPKIGINPNNTSSIAQTPTRQKPGLKRMMTDLDEVSKPLLSARAMRPSKELDLKTYKTLPATTKPATTKPETTKPATKKPTS